MKRFLLFFLAFALLMACEKEDITSNEFRFEKPAHFPEPTYPFARNPVTQAGFEVGKKLFNDPILSVDNSVACSNCHVKSVAFTDPQHRLSLGVEEREGIRNAPTIANMAFMKEFMWDGVFHLDFAPTNAIENELEMDETLANVIKKLNRHSSYPALFKKAFPEMDTITTPYLLLALSQFQVMLVSATSKYDSYRLSKATLSQEELEGLKLFELKCASCHSGELFTNQDYRNNGLDTVFEKDLGRARITETNADLGKFKVPSLRNVALTAPYMHDGRFNSLQEVLNHYNNGVKHSPTLATELQQNGKLGISISDTEKQRIITFLMTLTDYDFIQNPRF